MRQHASRADRLVEVRVDRGQDAKPQYNYGSGLIACGRTVVTAAHVLRGAKSIHVRNVRKEELHVGNLLLLPPDDGRSPDIAMFDLAEPTIDLEPLPLGRVDRDDGDELKDCVAAGYPVFGERTISGVQRREVQAPSGDIPGLSNTVSGLLSFRLKGAAPPLPAPGLALSKSVWAGMSGAPVFYGDFLLGVIMEHVQEGLPALTVAPLTALVHDTRNPLHGPGVSNPDAWLSRLGVASLKDLRLLPSGPQVPRPAVPETAKGIALQARGQELADLAAFTTGTDGYLWYEGEPCAGKTTFLAAFTQNRLRESVDVIACFLSPSTGHVNSAGFLRTAVSQLAELLGVTGPVASQHQFDILWQQAAKRATDLGRHLLLVVDALDEDQEPNGSLSVAASLPRIVAGQRGLRPLRAHVVVSSRNTWRLPADVPAAHPLRSAIRQTLAPVPIATEREDEAQRQLDSLRELGPAAYTVLGVMAAADGPVTFDDIQAWGQLERPDVDRVLRAADPILLTSDAPIGSRQGAKDRSRGGSSPVKRYSLAHRSLLDRVRDDDAFGTRGLRERIRRQAQVWQQRRWQRDGDEAPPLYFFDTFLGSLLDAEWDQLATIPEDTGWAVAALQCVSPDVVVTQLQTSAGAAPGSASSAGLLAVIRRLAPFLRSTEVDRTRLLLQLCLQAEELGNRPLAEEFRLELTNAGLVPEWTTRQTDWALLSERRGNIGWVNALALIDDRRIVSGGQDGRVRLWDDEVPSAGWIDLGRRHDGPVRALAVDQENVYSGGQDRRILAHDAIRPGADAAEIGTHDGAVRALMLHAAGLISGGDDGRVMLWRLDSPESPSVQLGRHSGAVRGITSGPAGEVVTAGDDGRIRIWDVDRPGSDVDHSPRLSARLLCLAAQSGGAYLAGGNDAWLYRWDRPKMSTSPIPAMRPEIQQVGSHRGAIRAITTAGNRNIVTAGDDGRIMLWHGGSTPGYFERRELGSHDGPARTLAIQGQHLVSGGHDQRIRAWDLSGGMISSGPAAGPRGRVRAATILSDGRIVVSAHDRALWIVNGPAEPPSRHGVADDIITNLISVDDDRILCATANGSLSIWEISSRSVTDVLRRGSPHAVGPQSALALVADEQAVMAGYNGYLQLLDLATGRVESIGRLNESPLVGVLPVPGGQVICGSIRGELTVWDLAGRREPVCLRPLGRRLNAIAALDGVVVGGADDGQIHVWDLTNHTITASVRAHQARINSMLALPSGRLASAGTDGQLRIWQWDGSSLHEVASAAISVLGMWASRLTGELDGLAVAHLGSGLSFWTVRGAR